MTCATCGAPSCGASRKCSTPASSTSRRRDDGQGAEVRRRVPDAHVALHDAGRLERQGHGGTGPGVPLAGRRGPLRLDVPARGAGACAEVRMTPEGCIKVAHPTREAALAHQKALVWKNAAQGCAERSAGLNVYLCDACQAFHVGHQPRVPLVWHYTV